MGKAVPLGFSIYEDGGLVLLFCGAEELVAILDKRIATPKVLAAYAARTTPVWSSPAVYVEGEDE